jgi:hypothetical protein
MNSVVGTGMPNLISDRIAGVPCVPPLDHLAADTRHRSAHGDVTRTVVERAPSGLGREWGWIQKSVELRSQERVGDCDRSPLYRDQNIGLDRYGSRSAVVAGSVIGIHDRMY